MSFLLFLVGMANAVLLDFGTSFPDFTAVGVGSYSTGNLSLIKKVAPGSGYSTETQIAGLLNTLPGNSFDQTEIFKFGAPIENLHPDGFFTVPEGFNWLVVQYDGPNGGSVVFQLSGNGATVPYDSSNIWGEGDKYAVSHFALAQACDIPPPPPPPSVPDGGQTVAMLGLGLISLGMIKRKVS